MISCSQYDYIEIACLYRLPVALTLQDGSVIQGTAKDTGRNTARQECMIVEDNSREHWIETAALVRMQALSDNPHFSDIHFQQQ
ncbi:Rho-binding antiterminator [Vibrio fluvialis]|nr:Rho-binding antiterminator [Vibrio fluvialis]